MSASRKQRRQLKKQARPQARQTKVISKFPEVVRSLELIGQMRGKGGSDEALALAQKLAAIEPGNPHILMALAGVLQDLRRFGEAIGIYQQCIAVVPRDAAAPAQMAVCLMETGDLPGTVDSCKEALKHAPDALGVHQLAGKAFERMARFREAAVHYKAVANKTGYHADYQQLGRTLFMANDIEGARAAFVTAIKAGAPKATTQVMLGRLETSRGNLDGAYAQLLEVLKSEPLEGYAHLQLADDFGDRINVDQHIALAMDALKSDQLPSDKHQAFIPLQFALANLHERNKDYDQAFAHFRTANETIVADQPDDHLIVSEQAEGICKTFSADHVRQLSAHGNASEQPVFVFGMPRSGTTLVEQILSSHPKAAGMGELEALSWMPPYLSKDDPERIKTASKCYLASFSREAHTAERVIDKSISTYLHAGLALSVFPNARLINCRRHPLDIAHSLYRMYFGPANVPFANSFGRIAARLRLYEHLMSHWHRTFPGRILDIRYEDLVSDPEQTSRRMVSHIGMDWDAACLAFHESKSIVQTASLTQVRQPIYATAVQKWRRYEHQFAALADDISDLVVRYETR